MNRNRKGFTLLELLIAMSLLVLIVAITMGAMSLASRSVEAGEKKMETAERIRTVTALLDAQIQSQMPLTYEKDGNKINYFQGDGTALRLATSHSVWGGRQGCLIVDYRIRVDGDGQKTLSVVEQTPGIEGMREALLFARASEISFEYFGSGTKDEKPYWQDQWSDEISLPQAVRLHLEYGPKKILFLFPVRAEAATVRVPATPVSTAGGVK